MEGPSAVGGAGEHELRERKAENQIATPAENGQPHDEKGEKREFDRKTYGRTPEGRGTRTLPQ